MAAAGSLNHYWCKVQMSCLIRAELVRTHLTNCRVRQAIHTAYLSYLCNGQMIYRLTMVILHGTIPSPDSKLKHTAYSIRWFLLKTCYRVVWLNSRLPCLAGKRPEAAFLAFFKSMSLQLITLCIHLQLLSQFKTTLIHDWKQFSSRSLPFNCNECVYRMKAIRFY